MDAKAVLIVLLFTSFNTLAQEKKTDTQPSIVFKSKAELVLVPVSVKDKSGKHVGGLKQDAFTVRQDGKEQKVSIFEEVATSSKAASRPKLPEGVITNAIGDAQQRRVIIIALDTINTAVTDQTYARENLVKYLSEQVRPDALLCLVTINRGGVRLIHDFTTDPKLLIAALRKVRGKTSMPEGSVNNDGLLEQLENDPMFQTEVSALNAFVHAQTEMQRNDWRMQVLVTLDALNQLSRAFAGVPGKKSLLWATGGFPLRFTDPNEAQNGPEFKEILPEYERTWELLNNANISVYPVDVRGLVNPAVIPASTPMSLRRSRSSIDTAMQQHMETISAMNLVADITGGRAFYNTNDLARSFERATEDSESYYLLGYYRDNNDTKPGWRKLKVDVHAEHAEVRSRTGFYVAKAVKNPEDTRKSDVRLALVSPLQYTGLAMLLQFGNPAVAKPDDKDRGVSKKRLPFELVMPASAMEIDPADSNHMRFEIFGLLTDNEGKQVADVGQTIDVHLKPEGLKQVTESGITYRSVFNVAPGDYTARLIVRDSLSGRIGSIITSLKVQ